jgi:threonyl-tRNA synthetase
LILALWLAPDQVRVIMLNDDAALIDYAKSIVNEMRANMVPLLFTTNERA